MENQMKTLLQVVSLAACVGGLPASSLFAERPMGNRNDGKGCHTAICDIEVAFIDPTPSNLGSDGYDCQGEGEYRLAVTYCLLVELGLTQYEAIVLIMTEGQRGANGQERPVSETEPKPTIVEPLYDSPHIITCDGVK